jgi:putative peptidoglycan binding protein
MEEQMQRSSKIRKELLLGTVALAASIGLASAQVLLEGGSTGGSEHEMSGSSQTLPSSGASKRGGEMRNERSEDAAKDNQSERQTKQGRAQSEDTKKGTSGKANSERRERSTTGEKSESTKGSASKEESRSKTEGKNEGMTSGRSSAQDSKKNAGQGSRERNERNNAQQGQPSSQQPAQTQQGQPPSQQPAQTQQGQSSQQPAQTQQGQSSSQQPAQTQTQAPQTGNQNQTTGAVSQSQQNAPQQSGTSIQSQAGATINAQQQTQIQQSVLSASNVPRVNNVNFAVRTNAVVPSNVNVVGVSTFPVLVEAFPRYRDNSFFVVEDDIVIVDRGRKIVDVVPAGPRAQFGRAGGATTTTSTNLNLSEPEIRELQQVLVDRGFYRGQVNGVFGPELREALIGFQRNQGFETTGSIDTRTVSALGLSGRIGQNAQGVGNQPANQSGMQQPSGQSGTSGQAPASQQNSSGQGNAPTQNQSQNQPASGQNNQPAQQQPSANNQPSQNNQGAAPSTTGQGNNTQSTTGQGGNMQSQQPSGSSQKQNPSNR